MEFRPTEALGKRLSLGQVNGMLSPAADPTSLGLSHQRLGNIAQLIDRAMEVVPVG